MKTSNAAAVCFALLVAPAAALAADERAGRYTMTPADGGFIRLDTDTGTMAMCSKRADAWSCEPMADSTTGLRKELERLEAENKSLKADIRRLEETFGLGDAKPDGDKKAEAPGEPGSRPGGKLQLPTEKDVDQAMDYVTRMLRKFRDKLKELEQQQGGSTPL